MGSDHLNPHCFRITIDVLWNHVKKLCEAAEHIGFVPDTIIDTLIDYGADIALNSKDSYSFLNKLAKMANREL
jgi:hypothetical protein